MNWSSAHVGHFLHDLVCQWLQLCACSLQRYRSSVDSSGLVCLCIPKHGLMWSEHPSGRKHLEVSQESPSSGRKHRAWFHTQTVPYKKTKARVSKRIQTALTSAEKKIFNTYPSKIIVLLSSKVCTKRASKILYHVFVKLFHKGCRDNSYEILIFLIFYFIYFRVNRAHPNSTQGMACWTECVARGEQLY